MLEKNVLVSVLNFIDSVPSVVNVLQVRGRVEVESSSELVPGCFESDEMLQVG